MIDGELETIMRKMAKGCFARYYHIFADDTLSHDQKCAEFRRTARKRVVRVGEEEIYTLDSTETRVRRATKIIKEGYTREAFDMIINSKAPEEDREKAEILLKELDAAELRQSATK